MLNTEQLRRHTREFIIAAATPDGPPTPETVGRFYDQNNEVLTQLLGDSMHYGYWTGPHDDSSFEVASARLTDIMIEKLRVGPGDTVLDLGCGTGKPAVHLASTTGARVIGVSVSTQDVAMANRRAEAAGMAGQARFAVADAMDLPAWLGPFDAVLALESIVHIPDRAHALKEVVRVLRPGGRVALTDFVSLVPEDAQDDEDERELAAALAAWRAAPLVRSEDYPRFAREAGLVIDEITDITEHAKYTFVKTYEAMREYTENRGELPPDLARIFEMTAGVDWSCVADEPPTEGVIIVAAHRPSEQR